MKSSVRYVAVLLHLTYANSRLRPPYITLSRWHAFDYDREAVVSVPGRGARPMDRDK